MSKQVAGPTKNLKTCREPNGNGLRATAAHQQGTIDRQRPVVR